MKLQTSKSEGRLINVYWEGQYIGQDRLEHIFQSPILFREGQYMGEYGDSINIMYQSSRKRPNENNSISHYLFYG